MLPEPTIAAMFLVGLLGGGALRHNVRRDRQRIVRSSQRSQTGVARRLQRWTRVQLRTCRCDCRVGGRTGTAAIRCSAAANCVLRAGERHAGVAGSLSGGSIPGRSSIRSAGTHAVAARATAGRAFPAGSQCRQRAAGRHRVGLDTVRPSVRSPGDGAAFRQRSKALT